MGQDSTTSYRIKRMQIQSWRRGIKEMDLILGNFANANLKNLTETELDLYDEVLLKDDHLLFAWISGAKVAPKEFKEIIEKISFGRKQ